MAKFIATGVVIYKWSNWPIAGDLVNRSMVVEVLEANPTWVASEIHDIHSPWAGYLKIERPVVQGWVIEAVIAPYPQR